MSLFRNTDVKKHLRRAIPRYTPLPALDKNLPTDDGDGELVAVPVAVAANASKKVETPERR